MFKEKTELILILGPNLKLLILKDDKVINSESHQLDSHDIIDGIIFNLTKLERVIKKFIIKHDLLEAPTIIILSDALVTETLIKNEELDPRIYHLESYELQYYPHSLAYHLGIKHYQLFQYFLLCRSLSIELTSVTTELLFLYKLFKTTTQQINSSVNTIPKLKAFLKNNIKEPNWSFEICHLTQKFDSLSTR